MRNLLIAATVSTFCFAGTAFANPISAVAVAQQLQAQGQLQGQEQNQGQTSSNNSSTHNDSTTVGAALGQAPTAISANSKCGKGTKFLFGLLEWTDYSDKCFDREMAMIAASQFNNWELANQWTERADNE